MTKLYRLTTEVPPFGSGSFWGETPSRASEIAVEVEDHRAGRPRLYEIDEAIEPRRRTTIDPHLLAQKVEASPALLRKGLLSRGAHLAAEDIDWIDYTEGPHEVYWGTLYMGDEPLEAELATDDAA